jgi:hypothetical protein
MVPAIGPEKKRKKTIKDINGVKMTIAGDDQRPLNLPGNGPYNQPTARQPLTGSGQVTPGQALGG